MGCFSRDRFDNEPGDNVPDGVIGVLGSRYVLRSDAERPIDDFLRVHGNIKPVTDHKVEAGVERVFSEAVSVVQYLANRDERRVVHSVEFVAGSPFVPKVRGDGCVNINESLLHQSQDDGRGDGFTDAGDTPVILRRRGAVCSQVLNSGSYENFGSVWEKNRQ